MYIYTYVCVYIHIYIYIYIYSPHRGAGLTIPTRCDQYPKGVGVLAEDLPELFRSSCGATCRLISCQNRVPNRIQVGTG